MANPTLRKRTSLESLPPEASPHKIIGCEIVPCPRHPGARPLLRPVVGHCSLPADTPTCTSHLGIQPRCQKHYSTSLR
eukprot:3746492-Pyramimonas_sp.AAC.1